MGELSGDDEIRKRARELARRIQLLQDVSTAERGRPYTFGEIRDFLAGVGVNLSQSRWSYVVAGEGALTTDMQLLNGIASLFEVDPAFLFDWQDPDLPERVMAQRDFVRALRVNKVTEFATRALGPLTPENMRTITKIVDSQLAAEFRDKES